ncbi:hypothetical protein M9458_046352, partial [Cirrhinus mrigala]
ELSHACAGAGQSHDPRGALQAHDVSSERAWLFRGAAAAPVPAGEQHGRPEPR